jgi:hypothetical protein
MAADLHIHILEYASEQDVAYFKSSTLGSKFFDIDANRRYDDPSNECVRNTAGVWVGEVSWLKANLFDQEETYIPGAVARVSELIGEEFPIITEELIKQIREAMSIENTTRYSVASADSVCEFLGQHIGKKIFTISW